MADEVLTQAEVESLLGAMESRSFHRAAASPRHRQQPGTERVVPYDFRHPERVGKEQLRTLQSIHEAFSRSAGAELSALLRTVVEVKLTSVDQLTYSEFAAGLENPTCLCVLRAEPLEGPLLLDIHLALVFSMIDRLLGGGGDAARYPRRPLTEIERRLSSRITQLLTRELARAWESVQPLPLAVDRVESNPLLLSLVPPGEIVVLIGFEAAIGELRGMLNLCLPHPSIERLVKRLASPSWSQHAQAAATPQSEAQIGRQLDRAMVEVVAKLAETKISTADLLGLRVGDIITTDQEVRSPLEVEVQGVPRLRAFCGAFKGKKAIEVEQVLPAAAPLNRAETASTPDRSSAPGT